MWKGNGIFSTQISASLCIIADCAFNTCDIIIENKVAVQLNKLVRNAQQDYNLEV